MVIGINRKKQDPFERLAELLADETKNMKGMRRDVTNLQRRVNRDVTEAQKRVEGDVTELQKRVEQLEAVIKDLRAD